jgi:hypothetical protein
VSLTLELKFIALDATLPHFPGIAFNFAVITPLNAQRRTCGGLAGCCLSKTVTLSPEIGSVLAIAAPTTPHPIMIMTHFIKAKGQRQKIEFLFYLLAPLLRGARGLALPFF